MPIPPKIRLGILAVMLTATLIAAFSEPGIDPAQEVRAVIRPRVIEPRSAVADDPPVVVFARKAAANIAANPFGRPVQPPPPMQVVPVAPPVAVQLLPFKYLGKLDDANAVVILLTNGGANYSAREGDMIEGVWQIKSIRSSSAEFLHVPTATLHTLSMGRDS